MTSIPGSTNETFTYDAEYRVNGASANGAISYIYDGEGRRVQKVASTFVTTYAYDTFGKVVAQYGVQNPTLTSPIVESGTEYLEGDHLGNTRVALNAAGEVVRRWDYLPFGEQIATGVGGRSTDYGPALFPGADGIQIYASRLIFSQSAGERPNSASTRSWGTGSQCLLHSSASAMALASAGLSVLLSSSRITSRRLCTAPSSAGGRRSMSACVRRRF